MRAFGHDIPRLSWLNAKTYPHSNPRKNRPGLKPELTAALDDLWAQVFAELDEKSLDSQ
jgi:hypothetical protein